MSFESGYFQILEWRRGHGTKEAIDRGDHRGSALVGRCNEAGRALTASGNLSGERPSKWIVCLGPSRRRRLVVASSAAEAIADVGRGKVERRS